MEDSRILSYCSRNLPKGFETLSTKNEQEMALGHLHFRRFRRQTKRENTLVHDMLTKLFKNYLLVTNISVSVAISATGDIIQQKYEQHHTISIQENSDNEMRFLTIR